MIYFYFYRGLSLICDHIDRPSPISNRLLCGEEYQMTPSQQKFSEKYDK